MKPGKKRERRSRMASETDRKAKGWKRWLHVTHYAALVTVVASFALLHSLYGDSDADVRRLGIIIAVVSVAWASVISVATISAGSKEAVLKSIYGTYKHFLASTTFLFASTGILLLAQGLLLWSLAAFRPVEFYSTEKTELVLNDIPGPGTSLAYIAGGSVSSVRLRIGLHRIGYRSVKTGEFGVLPPVQVHSWWSGLPLQVVQIPEIKHYEPLN